ncbi:hypothetical protein Q5Y75_07255 [Ruegeria sp. 2205SS24-7]|uniref:hypothetical protein n=1 Tax=Ruegeria discodermiae TaxID=3064389 RepID=UPI0027428468|nr:hypothetical protein [Ruegeria sp. 2205SS24-7]MDP5217009.1 hypothetical protein [Ruegeria sp. 2205SS24-7]
MPLLVSVTTTSLAPTNSSSSTPVPGETRLGDELNLLYPAEALLTSTVFAQLDFVWTGTEFAAP